MQDTVVTRFPPSPTGFLHIGSARTALFNHLFAAHSHGKMWLRFEDTDKERSKPEFEKNIVDGLAWLNIPYEFPEKPRQSERTEVYTAQLEKLIARGAAYEAEDAKDGSGKVIRFKNPNTSVSWADEVRGEVSFNTTDLGDFVIAKNLNEPLYHLAVVVDDHDMGVTHVVRGEDHISNTPRQILILEALGFTRPTYAHIPLILAPDKSKLSKRHGAVSVVEYREQGFIPEALVNYLALLGWNPGGEQEIFTLPELEKLFTLNRVHKAGAVFDIEKLRWINHEHLKRLPDAVFIERLEAFVGEKVNPALVPLLKERARTLVEAKNLLAEYDFLHEVTPTATLLTQNGKLTVETSKKHLTEVARLLGELSDESFTTENVKGALFPYATAEGRGVVLWPLRTALSGMERSPDPFTIASLIGKEKTLSRIEAALKII